jgi:hypothetical protein
MPVYTHCEIGSSCMNLKMSMFPGTTKCTQQVTAIFCAEKNILFLNEMKWYKICLSLKVLVQKIFQNFVELCNFVIL